MLKAQDLMAVDVVTLTDDTLATAAAESLLLHGISGAPVCDEQGMLVGVVSRSDLIQRIGAGHGSLRLRDIKSGAIISARPDDPAVLVAKLMAEYHVHRVLIVDEAGKLRGIVTTLDLCRAIADGRFAATSLPPVSAARPRAEG